MDRTPTCAARSPAGRIGGGNNKHHRVRASSRIDVDGRRPGATDDAGRSDECICDVTMIDIYYIIWWRSIRAFSCWGRVSFLLV